MITAMRLLTADTEQTLFGIDTVVWTVIVSALAIVVACYSALVSHLALNRTDVREHHRWLQEKRREAYVQFLTATRGAYEAISERGGRSGATDLREEDHPDPNSDEILAADLEIAKKYGDAKRALDILEIVGPATMADLGKNLMSRLRLDRTYYSPTRWSQLQNEQAKLIGWASDTNDEAFLAAMKKALLQDPVDLDAYMQSHSDHKLETFWNRFTQEAKVVLADPKPDRSGGPW